jgi:Mg-chelatase subunit ChlD
MEQNNNEKATERTTVHNLMILDESGSMQAIYNAALGGANETIQTIRSAEREHPDQEHRFTFVTFNTTGQWVKTVFDDVPIAEVRDLTVRDYLPDSCTPLYDAMGKAITDLERKVKEGEPVLVTVITDGYENASREYSRASVKAMVDRLREKGWTFVYIGANQDSEKVSMDLGVYDSMDFRADEEGTRAMWMKHRGASQRFYSRISFKEENSVAEFFTEEEKKNK